MLISPSVLTKCSLCSSHTLTHVPHERLKKTILGILRHTVIIFHHGRVALGSVTLVYAGSVVIGCAWGAQSDRCSIRRLCGGQPASGLEV